MVQNLHGITHVYCFCTYDEPQLLLLWLLKTPDMDQHGQHQSPDDGKYLKGYMAHASFGKKNDGSTT